METYNIRYYFGSSNQVARFTIFIEDGVVTYAHTYASPGDNRSYIPVQYYSTAPGWAPFRQAVLTQLPAHVAATIEMMLNPL
jgi:hypothetical protein